MAQIQLAIAVQGVAPPLASSPSVSLSGATSLLHHVLAPVGESDWSAPRARGRAREAGAAGHTRPCPCPCDVLHGAVVRRSASWLRVGPSPAAAGLLRVLAVRADLGIITGDRRPTARRTRGNGTTTDLRKAEQRQTDTHPPIQPSVQRQRASRSLRLTLTEGREARPLRRPSRASPTAPCSRGSVSRLAAELHRACGPASLCAHGLSATGRRAMGMLQLLASTAPAARRQLVSGIQARLPLLTARFNG